MSVPIVPSTRKWHEIRKVRAPISPPQWRRALGACAETAPLAERAKQMEQMEGELSMSHTQAAEYKHEISRITKELLDVKKKFYEQRKRELHVAELRRAERAQPTELLVQEARSTLNRFTGGGFNLNMPAS